MSSLLGLTAADIKKKHNPSNAPDGFLGSRCVSVTEADVIEAIEEFEETVLQRTPGRYQDLFFYVNGEVLCGGKRSMGGATGDGTETSFTCALAPVSDLKLYQNYPSSRPWTQRGPTDRLALNTDYTVNLTTGAITLITALSQGDTLIAEYVHSALSQCKLLRKIVKDLVAVEFARRLYSDSDRFERYLEWETQAYSDLARLHKPDSERGKLTLKLFDDIDLIDPVNVRRDVAPSGNFGVPMLS